MALIEIDKEHILREMDEEDIEELREFFTQCDADRNGLIQKDEFAVLLQSLGNDVSPAEVDVGFREIDRDNDGAIEFSEFLAYWQEH